MATISEAYEAEIGDDGTQPVAEISYFVEDCTTLQIALALLFAGTPATFDLYGDGSVILPKAGIHAKRVSDNRWEGQVNYETQAEKTVAPPGSSPEFSFDTTGATKRIFRAIKTWARYPDGTQTGTADDILLPHAPDMRGFIGVTKNGVEGIDVVVPSHVWEETHYLPASVVTSAYQKLCADLTGRVHANEFNDQGVPITDYPDFRGYAPGEVMLLGVTGAKRGAGDWELHFRFARIANDDAPFIVGDDGEGGGITVTAKEGWEYLEVVSEQTTAKQMVTEQADGAPDQEIEVDTAVIPKPRAVYIHQIAYTANFADLEIGTNPI